MPGSTTPGPRPADPTAMFEALGACWPAVEIQRLGCWTLRRGGGGGGRASAATLDGALVDLADAFDVAETGMRGMGQPPRFMIRPGEETLDAALAARGYAVEGPNLILAAPAAELGGAGPDWGTVRCAAPLARMIELWQANGIGAGRRAVMDRAPAPKVWLLVRDGDRPAGCAFADIHADAGGAIAMVHSVVVDPTSRRRGLGARLVRAAGRWAATEGAATLALAVGRANLPAVTLYQRLGMAEAGAYHYRVAAE